MSQIRQNNKNHQTAADKETAPAFKFRFVVPIPTYESLLLEEKVARRKAGRMRCSHKVALQCYDFA